MNDASEDKILYQTSSRIALLEQSMSVHEKEIAEIKQNHKDVIRLLFERLEVIKQEMHSVSMFSKDIIINQQKESNKNKMWMLGILIGFIAQTCVGFILLIIEKGGF